MDLCDIKDEQTSVLVGTQQLYLLQWKLYMIFVGSNGSEQESTECVRIVHDSGKLRKVEDGVGLSRSRNQLLIRV